MSKKDSQFRTSVESLVSRIPAGRVMTYGQLAALAGSPRAARVVGGIAHFGDPELPWHRVVNQKGGLASGYPGGSLSHKEVLESEGYVVSGEEGQFYVDVDNLIWWPYFAESGEDGILKNED
ncbi:MAG: methylated-DNA-protein-cysteine methyltransferase-like protein [Candidatus Saccharimonadales bacterium]|jgi:methylated-DNA-protein-cysteine methyltransferase-like protein